MYPRHFLFRVELDTIEIPFLKPFRASYSVTLLPNTGTEMFRLVRNGRSATSRDDGRRVLARKVRTLRVAA